MVVDYHDNTPSTASGQWGCSSDKSSATMGYHPGHHRRRGERLTILWWIHDISVILQLDTIAIYICITNYAVNF